MTLPRSTKSAGPSSQGGAAQRVRRVAPIAAASSVALAGFGGLLVLWLVGDWRDDVPGLFDYRSATLGDGLLLPVVVGLLVAALRTPLLVRADHEWRWGTVAAVAGALAGAATQAAWLLDDHPAPNWSFPEAHRFNLAGWYHAVFLTFASATITALAVLAARRARATRRTAAPSVERLARRPAIALLFGCAVAMAGLIAADNDRAAPTMAGQSTLVALGAAAATTLALLAWAFGSSLRAAAPQLAAAGLLAVGLVVLLA